MTLAMQIVYSSLLTLTGVVRPDCRVLWDAEPYLTAKANTTWDDAEERRGWSITLGLANADPRRSEVE